MVPLVVSAIELVTVGVWEVVVVVWKVVGAVWKVGGTVWIVGGTVWEVVTLLVLFVTTVVDGFSNVGGVSWPVWRSDAVVANLRLALCSEDDLNEN